MFRIIFMALVALSLLACTPPQSSDGHPVIMAYSQAYNDKDLAKMTSLMHPDIEWLSVSGEGMEVAAKGKDVLAAEMKRYFEAPTMPEGALNGWSLNGDYIAVTETASWTDDAGQDKSQSALTVYQIENNLVRRVWYYPAQH